MSQKNYQINHGNITSKSEETSTVSKTSYEIEHANNNGLEKCQRSFDVWFYDFTWK
ncbi:hypothetical protein K4Q22_10715 [Staphylococcus epidermidis]|nr:hypothetical protein [Staphylococcus epidermidis]